MSTPQTDSCPPQSEFPGDVHLIPVLQALDLQGTAYLVGMLMGPAQVLIRLTDALFWKSLHPVNVALISASAWPRIQIMRDEDDALDKLQREEASADAAARRRADQVAATKAEREARKQAKQQALRAAA